MDGTAVELHRGRDILAIHSNLRGRMISCKFIYQHNNGATSDSLVQFFDVVAVPRIGEQLAFIGSSDSVTRHVVKNVAHLINADKKTAEIWVYYGA